MELFEDFIDHQITGSRIVTELQIKIFKSALQINSHKPDPLRTQVIDHMRNKYNLSCLKICMRLRNRADPDSETEDIHVWVNLETGLIHHANQSRSPRHDRSAFTPLIFTVDMHSDFGQQRVIKIRPDTQAFFGALIGKSASPKIPVSAEDWPDFPH